MRIGIDAQMLCRSVTGIERYAYEIILEIVRQKPEAELFLYAPLPLSVKLGESNNITIRHSNVKIRGMGTLWSQTTLPIWANNDCLDVFWGPTHRMPRLISRKVARVVTIHDLVWKHAGETMRPLGRLAEQVLMPNAINVADRVVADSQSTADAIAAEFPHARNKTQVVYLGATAFPAPGPFDSLTAFGIDRPYFLFVGTLEPRKNLCRLLKAYASLSSEHRKRCLLVIAGGKGWGNEDLATLIHSLGVGESVRLTGYVDDVMLATLYRHTRFLAMPSLYEGFGLPLVEAMSFGAPVLTSDTSSLPEVAGDAGVLVDPLSVSSVADGLTKMIADDGLRDGLASKAKANAARFSWQNTTSQLLKIFEEAILSRKQNGRTSE